MHNLIAAIPGQLFWGVIAGWVLGVLTTWRFAGHVQRLRDSLYQARHNWQRWTLYVKDARNQAAAVLAAAGLMLLVLGGVGMFVWARLHS